MRTDFNPVHRLIVPVSTDVPVGACPFCHESDPSVVRAVAAAQAHRIEDVYVIQCDSCLAQGPGAPEPLEAVLRWSVVLQR
jgi:hypothetical protein